MCFGLDLKVISDFENYVCLTAFVNVSLSDTFNILKKGLIVVNKAL